MTRRPHVLALLPVLLLAGCGGGWFGGGEDDPPLPGRRVPVLLLEPELRPDPSVEHVTVTLPPPEINRDWPQSGGVVTHAMQHLAAGDRLALAWRTNVGTVADGAARQLSRPVIADGKVFTIDAYATITALRASDGSVLWTREAEDSAAAEAGLGGGLAYQNGWLFAAFSNGEVVGMNARSGEEVWRRDLVVPIRTAPAVAGGKVLVLTADNQLYALNGADGQPVWRHAGYFETAGLLGGPTPAVGDDVVVAPYSSGEVFALGLESGLPLWGDSVQRPRRTVASADINDIDGFPVIDGDRVYVAGNGGEMAAIDLERGTRLWDQDLTSNETPWVAGEFIYALTVRGEVVCLLRDGGRVRWVSPLPRFEDPADPASEPITWSGPVLAGDRLLLAGSNGRAVSMSPYTGELLGEIELPDGVSVPPVVADGTVYILTNGGDLLAYR